MLQKSIFCICQDSLDFGVFVFGFGINVGDFRCHGDRLEVLCFSMAVLGGLELRDHGRWLVVGSSKGPMAETKQYEEALQHDKYNIKHAGVKRYEKARVQITKIRKNKAAM